MKKFVKLLLLTVASLFWLSLISVVVLLWIVFTPERITPIINNQAAKHINCDFEIGKVDLTFFSTFPRFGLKVDNFTMINKFDGAPSDTLASLDQLVGVIDISKFLFKNEIVLSDIRLKNGTVNAYVDSLGNSNFDVFDSEPKETEEESDFELDFLDIGKVAIQNINLLYIDEHIGMSAIINDLDAEITGNIFKDIINTDIKLTSSYIAFVDESLLMSTVIDNFSFDAKAKVKNNNIVSDFKIRSDYFSYNDETYKIDTDVSMLDIAFNGTISDYNNIESDIKIKGKEFTFAYAKEEYMHKTDISLESPARIDLKRQYVNLIQAKTSLNDLDIILDGSMEIDPENWDIHNDVSYTFEDWSILSLLAIIPPDYHSYFEDIFAEGFLSSKGKITGIFNDSLMPLMDINLTISNASFNSPDLPLPLSDINGNIDVFTDLIDSKSSVLKVNNLRLRTPKSRFELTGVMTDLYEDLYSRIKLQADIELEEFNQMFPDTINLDMKGNIKASINTDFLLSSMENMRLPDIKVFGSLTARDIDVMYDSIYVINDYSKLEFWMPNPDPSTEKTSLALATLLAGNISAGKIDDYQALLQNISMSFESSDFMDTTAVPDMICYFKMDSIFAGMQADIVSVKNPSGIAKIYPDSKNPKHTGINIQYNSDALVAATTGTDANINKIDVNVDIVHNPDEVEEILQYIFKGALSLSDGNITTDFMNYPIEIPHIKMDFDSENLQIHESRMRIDKSDFSLSGYLNNVMAYVRGDSVLYGRLNFDSDNTDVLQLMMLTSGIGHEEDDDEIEQADIAEKEETTEEQEQEEFYGPYMVPKGVDIVLKTNIKQASYGDDVATNILGEVRLADGILLLDRLRFTTPAARMMLTAMYRTPRKNHLYLGIDYHMLDIEIEELLRIIPDIDSIMPMLRSFRGKGEFHIAGECYMDSTYNVKISTLRASSSISGQNLVLLDGETFTEIANALRFTKQAENKIDSLSAEFTVFREEIDVYPFIIVMDRYKAVVGGRHNVDMSFIYNIDIVDSPLPVKLGVNIRGDLDNLSFRPGRTNYPEFYRPARRDVVRTSQIELRNRIRESIKTRIELEDDIE